MNIIKFDLEFKKLMMQSNARLIYVEVVYKEKLHVDFIVYDVTDIWENKYELEGEEFTKLTFIGNKGIPFTTLRSIDKYDKYKTLIGEQFKVKIKGR